MKRFTLYWGLLLGTLLFLMACSDTDIIKTGGGTDGALSIIYTTPTLSAQQISSEPAPESRATHTGAEAKTVEDNIASLHVLFFDTGEADGKLLRAVQSTLGTPGKATITATPYRNVYVRIVTNISAATTQGWVGKTWSELQGELFAFSSAAGSYPMYADAGVKNLKEAAVIGTPEDPVKLIRSVAKIAVENTGGTDFVFQGFRTFQISNQGYVFPQAPVADNSGFTTSNEATAAYGNDKTEVFVPETDGVTDNKQTFIVVKATYKGVEGYYRIDIRDEEGEWIPITRNTHYLIKLNGGIGYGYATEAEALEDSYNDHGKAIEVSASDSYDHVYNSNQNFFGFTNSTTVIYGKAEYYNRGYAGAKTIYPYVITQLQTDKGTIAATDVTILDNGGLNVSIVSPAGGATDELLVTATMAGVAKGTVSHVKLRYKNMVKTIKVVWMGEYIDCTYWNLPLMLDGTPLRSSHAEVKSHIDATGTEVTNSNFSGWVGLSSLEENATYSANENDVSKYLPRTIENSIGPKYVQFRENLNYLHTKTMNNPATEPEGFRFIDVYAGGVSGEGTVKYIFAQANADLSGYFGSSQLVAYSELNNDDGTKYDSYLVSERITDEIYTLGTSLAEYCKNKNPKGETIWYLPSHRQLIGLWLTNNSNSRKTSPMNVAPAATPTFRYISRSTYTQAHSIYYEIAKTFSDGLHNPDNGPLNVPSRYPIINFSNGNSSRVAQSGLSNAIRCVRNLPNSKSTTSPVSGRTVTIDPADRLSDDYFNQTDWNPIARKIAVVEPPKPSDKTIVYKWTSTAGSGYKHIRTTNSGGIFRTYKHEFAWTDAPGWQRNGVDRYEKHKGESYTVENYNSNPPPPDNKDIGIPEKLIDHEMTLTNAYRYKGNHRLPTARELHMLYIYEPLFNSSGVTSFYKDEADGYYESPPSSNPSATSVVPNRLLYAMRLYPLGGSTAYMHWYWSSTIDGGSFSGNDSGIIPHRMNFHFGDMNRRGSGESGALDHVRYVDTVE